MTKWGWIIFKCGENKTSRIESDTADESELLGNLPESNLNWSDASTKLTKEAKPKNIHVNLDISIFIKSTDRSETVFLPCISDLVCLVWC